MKAGRVLAQEHYRNRWAGLGIFYFLKTISLRKMKMMSMFRFCIRQNEVNARVDAFKKLKQRGVVVDKRWLLFAVIRDPLDRFLSGFVDKCIR